MSARRPLALVLTDHRRRGPCLSGRPGPRLCRRRRKVTKDALDLSQASTLDELLAKPGQLLIPRRPTVD